MPTLKSMLTDPHLDVQKAVVNALKENGSAVAADALTIGGPEAAKAAAAVLACNDPRKRCAAAEVLGLFPLPLAESPLVAGLLDSNADVRRSVAKSLTSLGWTPTCDERGAAYWAIREEWAKCMAIGSPAIDVVTILFLTDEVPQIRRQAAAALAGVCDEGAYEALMAASMDRDDDVIQAAVAAFSCTGASCTGAVRALGRMLSDSLKQR